LSLPTLKKIRKTPLGKVEMSFVDHLEALRWHLVRSVIAVLVLAIIVFLNIDWVFDHIIYGPMRADFVSYRSLCSVGHAMHFGEALCMPAPDVKMQVTSFGSQFMSSISISFISGFIIAFPYIFWELWLFIKPALSSHEIRASRGGIFWVTFFFLCGVGFAYFLIAPFTFSFLANYKLGALQALETKPTLDDYIDNMMNIIIGTGLAFELPVISAVLTRIGLINPAFLKTYRKYAYVIILIAAAVITPSPDWMSQMIVATPLFGLYEISILISYRMERDNLRRQKEFFNS
jgi:sec-independent protein translocase protein TatC